LASQINASNSGFGGIVSTGDSSGELQLQTAGTTAVTINTSQRAAFVAGTAVAPAITTSGDTNTGIFFPAADTTAFAEGGVEAMRIDSSGNVGIGTTSPSQKLSVISTASDVANFKTNQTNTDIYLTASGSTADGYVRLRGTGDSMVFITGLNERMRIDSSGNFSAVIPSGSTYYPAFWCRAWVNFNGTGTVAIRASGNVTSITDGGVGNYTINFSTAMPDTNYTTTLTCSGESRANSARVTTIATTGSTSAVTMDIYNPAASAFQDAVVVMAAIFR